MYRIAFIVPNQEMTAVVESVIKQDAAITMNIHNAPPYSYSVHIAQTVRELSKDVINADIVIARGHIYEDLRRGYPNMSLVELPIGSEMTAAVVSAINKYGQVPVAVIGSFSMCYAAQAVKDLFDVDVKAYLLENRETSDIRAFAAKALCDDRKVFICGYGMEEFINIKKAPDIHVHTMGLSRESVLEAITWAKGEMVTRKREKERAGQFQLLLNIAHEGIIATDSDGRINAINQNATELLGVSAPTAMGANLWSVLPKNSFSESALRSFSAQVSVEYNGEPLSIRVGRLIMAGETAGMIVTLQRGSA